MRRSYPITNLFERVLALGNKSCQQTRAKRTGLSISRGWLAYIAGHLGWKSRIIRDQRSVYGRIPIRERIPRVWVWRGNRCDRAVLVGRSGWSGREITRRSGGLRGLRIAERRITIDSLSPHNLGLPLHEDFLHLWHPFW